MVSGGRSQRRIMNRIWQLAGGISKAWMMKIADELKPLIVIALITQPAKRLKLKLLRSPVPVEVIRCKDLEQFRQAVSEVDAPRLSGAVVELRFLEQAMAICRQFKTSPKIVVATLGIRELRTVLALLKSRRRRLPVVDWLDYRGPMFNVAFSEAIRTTVGHPIISQQAAISWIRDLSPKHRRFLRSFCRGTANAELDRSTVLTLLHQVKRRLHAFTPCGVVRTVRIAYSRKRKPIQSPDPQTSRRLKRDRSR